MNASETNSGTCDGLGVCTPAPPSPCAPYGCAGTTCAKSCSGASTGCSGSASCSGGVCVPDGLMLHWRLDEASGTTALDASTHGYAGTYVGATGIPMPSTLVPAVEFPNPRSRAWTLASRHAVRLTPTPAALKPATDLTVSLWFRATVFESGGSELLSAGDQYVLRLYSGTRLGIIKRLGPVTPGFLTCPGTLATAIDGQWHHVAGVISATGMKLYGDGELICTNTDMQPIVYDKGPDFVVGRHGTNTSGFPFDGNIDEVRVYTRVLSPAEIAALAAGGF